MSDEVSWMLELRVVDDQAFRPLMAEMVAATRANEPGTLGYEWSTSADGSTCHLHERYADSAAALIHIGTFGARYAARFLRALTPTRLVVYGSPDAAVREALAGMAPVYMQPAAGFRR